MNGRHWLIERMKKAGAEPCLVHQDCIYNYDLLAAQSEEWKARLGTLDCASGAVVAFQGDYSPTTVSLLLACLELGNIAVPLAPGLRNEISELLRISEARILIRAVSTSPCEIQKLNVTPQNALLKATTESETAGLVIFSSGSTGVPKATLHDLARFLMKFERQRAPLTTIAVPPMDHIAGLDTLFYCLSSGGKLVCLDSRNPEEVCMAVERHRVELLPASAAFLNLLLASGAMERHDLSSLRTIAYGSDVMPTATLSRLREHLPAVTLLQKYGTTELGSPSTRSRPDGSLWLKINDEGCEAKVVEGALWIKSQSAMLGYLNAPSPFEEDGWINTGDMVEQSDGGYLRILGRQSDLINVGGHKVFPAEVETVLLQLSNVEDVLVYGKSNPLLGKVVAARFRLKEPEDVTRLKQRVRRFCHAQLSAHKIPVEIEIAAGEIITARQKKIRRESALAANG